VPKTDPPPAGLAGVRRSALPVMAVRVPAIHALPVV